VNGAIPMAEVRVRAAAALERRTDSDPPVLFDYPDSVSPPALVLTWDTPWLTPLVVGGCLYDARFAVHVMVARIDPAIGELERLIAYVVGRLRADPYPWPMAIVEQPLWLRIADVPLFGARVIYTLKVSVEPVESEGT